MTFTLSLKLLLKGIFLISYFEGLESKGRQYVHNLNGYYMFYNLMDDATQILKRLLNQDCIIHYSLVCTAFLLSDVDFLNQHTSIFYSMYLLCC